VAVEPPVVGFQAAGVELPPVELHGVAVTPSGIEAAAVEVGFHGFAVGY
jgi:hypothetical protein